MGGSISVPSRAALLALALLLPGTALGQADAVTTCRGIVSAADRAPAQPGGRAVAGADYVPGVDVRGNPVAPADLGGAPRITLPEELVLPVTPDVFTFLGRDPPRGLDQLRVNVGELRIRLSDGRTTFNGQPLGPAADAELVAACRQLLANTTAR
jgi:hypothetical protein